MSYTKDDLKSMASDLCGIDSDSEGVAAINKAIDYLTEQAEKMELNEREGKDMDKEVKLVFTAFIKVTGDDPIAEAMDKAQADYGNEVADYGVFTIEGESNE